MRRWFTASLIAATLAVAALIGVYFGSEMVAFATRYADQRDIDDVGTIGGQEGLKRNLSELRTLSISLALKLLPEAAHPSQFVGPRKRPQPLCRTPELRATLSPRARCSIVKRLNRKFYSVTRWRANWRRHVANSIQR